MKVVALSVITEQFGLVDAASAKTVEEVVVKFISGLIQQLGDSKIKMILAATECCDNEFAHQVEKKIFEAVPELFDENYVWSESY